MFLRAVHNPLVRTDEKRWDALDQLDDLPKSHEEIFVYKLANQPQRVHLKMSKRSESGFYMMAEYRFVEDQPPDDVLRDTIKWRLWCDKQLPPAESAS